MAHPGCRRLRRPREPSPCLRGPGPSLRRAASQPQPAPICTGTRGGAPRRDRLTRCRRETVAWKLGRGRSHRKAVAEGRAEHRRGGTRRCQGARVPVCDRTHSLSPDVGTTGVKRGKGRPGPTGGRLGVWGRDCGLGVPPLQRCGVASVRQRAPETAPTRDQPVHPAFLSDSERKLLGVSQHPYYPRAQSSQHCPLPSAWG